MKKFLGLSMMLMLTGFAFAQPVVDGTVAKGEYSQSKVLVGGNITLSYAADGKGGLFIGVSARTVGWVGVGLGAQRMNGAYIYMGSVDAGKAVFSEQVGKGYRHSESGKATADQSSVKQSAGVTTVEFHIPAGQLPFSGKSVDFIVASAGSPDLKTFHGESLDTGNFQFP